MRNLYNEKRLVANNARQSISKWWQLLSLLAILLLTTTFSMAQTTMTWTGAENTRFDNENNWDPAGSISGNTLNIPAYLDSVGNTLFPNLPVLTGTTHYTVKEINVTFDKAFPDRQGSYTVELESDADSLILDNGGTIQYSSTGIIIKKGTVLFNSYKRFDQVGTTMTVSGGNVIFKRYLIMRNGNDMTTGGHITLSGGKIRLNGGFHDRVNKTINQWTITGDAILEVSGNYGSVAADIESGWIDGGDDFSILRSYNAVTNITTYSAVPATSFLISNADRQVVVANNAGTTLNMIPTKKVTTAKSLTWKYRKQGETTYTAFTDTQDSLWYTPTFVNSGVYYVICEGVDDGGATVKSQEVEFFIGSDAITIDPLFTIQYLRPAETGAELTASFTGTASSMEWKYSTTPSGPYQSFATPFTTEKFVPAFDSTGNYYVVLEAMIGSMKQISFELYYLVESASTVGKGLTWTGLVSNEGSYPANWTPVANTFRNSLNVNAFDSTSTAPYPVYTKAANDTIQDLIVNAGATMTIDGPDSLDIRGGSIYINGTLNVKKGVLTQTTSYFRVPVATGVLNLMGNSELHVKTLLMGNSGTPTDGGSIYITDNARLYNDTDLPGRICADTLESVTYISDNGQEWFVGDARTTVQGWIDALKIVCPAEGWEPYMLYDAEMNYTVVKARNTNAFSVDNDQKTYTTANYPVEEAIGLTNVDGVTSWEWKYSNNINGPWMSFSPAAKDLATYNPTFAESGTYYVVAETADGQITSNVKPIVVIDLGITPNDPQAVQLGADGTPLMAVIPSQFTVTAISWYYREAGSEEYFQTGVEDSIYVPNFSTKGVYEVFYGVEVQDEFGVQYFLQSSAVEITAGNVGVEGIFKGMLKIYPNPTTGKFYITGNVDGNYTVEIVDLKGTVVYREDFAASNKQAIHFSEKGFYLVKVRSNQNTRIGRLVVQ